MTRVEPGWLADWRARSLTPEEALRRFDSQPPLAPEAMLGRWRGAGLPTGHRLDGVLEALGWHGKEFHGPDDVQPLLFAGAGGRPVPLNPALLPARLAIRFAALGRTRAGRAGFAALRPALRARGPTARLRAVAFRGIVSAAMIYDRQPIVDHFRAAGDGLVLGVIDMRGIEPFFFLLGREAAGQAADAPAVDPPAGQRDNRRVIPGRKQ